MNIFMQVFGVCKSYNHTTDLSTYTPTRPRANHRLVCFGGFGTAISDAAARSSIVFCNSVCANRIVMAASRLLGAAAACVILVSFAAGHRESYWSGCFKAVIVIC